MCFKAWFLTRESEIALRALEEPLRQIAANDTYGDMVEMGVLDPTKVTRTHCRTPLP